MDCSQDVSFLSIQYQAIILQALKYTIQFMGQSDNTPSSIYFKSIPKCHTSAVPRFVYFDFLWVPLFCFALIQVCVTDWCGTSKNFCIPMYKRETESWILSRDSHGAPGGQGLAGVRPTGRRHSPLRGRRGWPHSSTRRLSGHHIFLPAAGPQADSNGGAGSRADRHRTEIRGRSIAKVAISQREPLERGWKWAHPDDLRAGVVRRPVRRGTQGVSLLCFMPGEPRGPNKMRSVEFKSLGSLCTHLDSLKKTELINQCREPCIPSLQSSNEQVAKA